MFCPISVCAVLREHTPFGDRIYVLFARHNGKKGRSLISTQGESIQDLYKSLKSFVLKYLICHYWHLANKVWSVSKPFLLWFLCRAMAYQMSQIPEDVVCKDPGRATLSSPSVIRFEILARHFTCDPKQSVLLSGHFPLPLKSHYSSCSTQPQP